MSKRSGPTKESTKKLVIELKKKAKKEKVKLWKKIAEEIEKPARKKRAITTKKLEALVKKFKNKIFVTGSK
ncbi:MAG: hypothetical protein N3D84_04190, partial [Candidatus Woesearchaeota archaeon]|nr:hypothetical protein [Candidatus Woesearchaeota archaeon]